MNSGDSTSEPEASVQDDASNAAVLADRAEELLATVAGPGRWPEPDAVQRFIGDGSLERVLADYLRAMSLDPEEPAYPWNLASSLSRLGLHELALGFMLKAVHVASLVGDDEWANSDAQLAAAEIAVAAGEHGLAEAIVARAIPKADERREVAASLGLSSAFEDERDADPVSQRMSRDLGERQSVPPFATADQALRRVLQQQESVLHALRKQQSTLRNLFEQQAQIQERFRQMGMMSSSQRSPEQVGLDRLMAVVRENPGMTLQEIADELNVRPDYLDKALKLVSKTID